MKKIISLFILIPIFFFSSCATQPAKTPSVEPVPAKTPATESPKPDPVQKTQPTAAIPETDTVVAQFDEVPITKQTFENTKTEMQMVVEKLNKITYERDYQSWLGWLSDDYYNTYSDPATLETVSASLPTKGMKLHNLKDYFNYVFVPSRQNMRVDNIQFVSPTRVYVIMEIMPGSPAAIYILEKTKQGWKLVPKNQ
jgi:hypothetical protein